MTITLEEINNKLNNSIKYSDLIIVIKRLELIFNINLSGYITELNHLAINKENIIKNLYGRDKNIQLFYLDKNRVRIINEIITKLPAS
jgi:uncharacterized pyridoxamine 5'-phosphate oxidase family protein